MTTRLEKPLRRVVKISGLDYVVELSPGGLLFRRVGMRQRAAAPLAAVLALANEYATRDARREELRAAVLRRRTVR